MISKKLTLLIKLPYWLGIIADAVWAIGFLSPPAYGVLTGQPNFNPGFQHRLTLSVAGILIMGWTFLLIWGVRNPVERRFIILLTAFPTVFGLSIVSFISYHSGNPASLWIVAKTIFLFMSMLMSYALARKIARRKKENELNCTSECRIINP